MTKFTSKSLPWHKTLKEDENGCLVCDNIKNHDGYVRVNSGAHSDSKLIMLHVLRWELKHGRKPKDMEINHKCGNRGCCNLEHLELIDGSAHATLTNVNRVGITMTKQEDSVVADIYERVKYKGDFINQICRELGVKRSTVSSIVNKRSRCRVTDLIDLKYLGEQT